MKTKIKVSVTRKDIKKGEPADSNSCPVALALRRSLKPRLAVLDLIQVDQDHLHLFRVLPNGSDVFVKTPRKAASFITAFDGYNETFLEEDGEKRKRDKPTIAQHKRFKKRIKPFSFSISLTDKILKKGKK